MTTKIQIKKAKKKKQKRNNSKLLTRLNKRSMVRERASYINHSEKATKKI